MWGCCQRGPSPAPLNCLPPQAWVKPRPFDANRRRPKAGWGSASGGYRAVLFRLRYISESTLSAAESRLIRAEGRTRSIGPRPARRQYPGLARLGQPLPEAPEMSPAPVQMKGAESTLHDLVALFIA